MDIDAIEAAADRQILQLGGKDADLYLSGQTPGTDPPDRPDIRVIYDESYQKHEADGYASYHQAVSLPKNLGESLVPSAGMLLVIGSAEYELLQRIAVDGTNEVWSVSK